MVGERSRGATNPALSDEKPANYRTQMQTSSQHKDSGFRLCRRSALAVRVLQLSFYQTAGLKRQQFPITYGKKAK